MNLVYKSLVYSNLWVGLAVVALTFISLEPLYFVPFNFLAFVFCATAFSYSYMRLVQLKSYDIAEEGIKRWASEHPFLSWAYTFFFGGISLFFFLRIDEPDLVWLMILPGAISLIYPITFKKAFSGFTSLRSVPGIKVLLISLNWSYVTVLVPTALYMDIELDQVIEFVMRGVLIVALVIPFDIRDQSLDDINLRTLPQVFGVGSSKQIAMFGIFLYQLWLLFRVLVFGYPIASAVALIIGFEVANWLIRYTNPDRKEAYFSFWLESVPIISALLLVIAKLLF